MADYLSRNLLSEDTTEQTDEDHLPEKLDKAHKSLISYPNTQFQTGGPENQNKEQNIQNQSKSPNTQFQTGGSEN